MTIKWYRKASQIKKLLCNVFEKQLQRKLSNAEKKKIGVFVRECMALEYEMGPDYNYEDRLLTFFLELQNPPTKHKRKKKKSRILRPVKKEKKEE